MRSPKYLSTNHNNKIASELKQSHSMRRSQSLSIDKVKSIELNEDKSSVSHYVHSELNSNSNSGSGLNNSS